jgi:hypothetical protein
VYENIFVTLQAGLSKLGNSPTEQTKALKGLIKLIKDIPTDSKQDYDVLGYVYEYLIGNFAANAGKKAGEFYTPHEVAILMSEIVAEHHKDKDKIEIYGLNKGEDDSDKIKELKDAGWDSKNWFESTSGYVLTDDYINGLYVVTPSTHCLWPIWQTFIDASNNMLNNDGIYGQLSD